MVLKLKFCPLIKDNCKGLDCMLFLTRDIADQREGYCSIRWIADYIEEISDSNSIGFKKIADVINKKN